MVAADADRPISRGTQGVKERRDTLDALLVVVGLRERYIAEVPNATGRPWREAKFAMHPTLRCRHMADRPWAQVLIALRRPVPRAVRYPHQAHIASGRVRLKLTPKQGRRTPPICPFEQNTLVIVQRRHRSTHLLARPDVLYTEISGDIGHNFRPKPSESAAPSRVS